MNMLNGNRDIEPDKSSRITKTFALDKKSILLFGNLKIML